MNPLLLSGLFSVGQSLIERFFPDPEKKAAAQLELLKMQQNGELQALANETELAKAQLLVNQAEAGSGSIFVGGWRPAIGWICASGLFYEFLLSNLLPWTLQVTTGRVIPPMPELPMETLTTLVFGMLGLGGLRTIEKIKGTK